MKQEIRKVWQTMKQMMPATMASPTTLQKRVKIINPRKVQILSDTPKTGETTIRADLWVLLPSKSGRPAPQNMPAEIIVSGFELINTVDIDLALLKQRKPAEMIKGYFVATLLAKGIFNNIKKREAFLKLADRRK